MRVIGTAGHVDHGKSTLVRALSGIDPDRLKEEKARGMTIDLGFAWVDLPLPAEAAEAAGAAGGAGAPGGKAAGKAASAASSPAAGPVNNTGAGTGAGTGADTVADTVAGIVDVPGHIDFIKNMLAGVGGIDLALLVIAADEGVMPQTREHLAILDLLAVPAAVVALTKIDRAEDPEWLDLVELDVHELLAQTRLAGAPVVRVDSLSGRGLDELRRQLAQALANLPPRRNRAQPRLPVDRVFSLSGLGTVVTGTLGDGVFTVGEAVEILPARLPARIRGMQTHKQPVARGEPGSRLAINLAGVGVEELRRGDVVARPGALSPTTLIDVRFRLLPAAPRPLAHNGRVDFFCGAAEIGAYVRVLGAEQLAPGDEGFLQLRLDRPTVLLPGDRFILRQPSPSQTLGGGDVLSANPRRRWRRFDAAALARLQTLSRGEPGELLLQALARRPLVNERELLAASGVEGEIAAASLAELHSRGLVKPIGADGGEPLLLALDTWAALLGRLAAYLENYHRQYPLRRGAPRSEVRSRLPGWLAGAPAQLGTRTANALLSAAEAEGQLAGDAQTAWLPGFAPQPDAAQAARVAALLARFAAAPFTPPNLQDSMQLLGEDAELLAWLLEGGQLVRLGGDVLLRRVDFDAMLEGVRAHLAQHGSVTLAEVRDLFGASRKYVQAVLEEMDARRITRREGEGRVLRT